MGVFNVGGLAETGLIESKGLIQYRDSDVDGKSVHGWFLVGQEFASDLASAPQTSAWPAQQSSVR